MALQKSPEQYGKDTPEWIRQTFMTIDTMDAKKFSECITPDGTLVFGSNPPVKSREGAAEFIGGFFTILNDISHTLERTWEVGDTTFVKGDVTYDLKATGKVVTVPFLDVFHMKGDLIHEYLVYMDPTPLAS